MNLPRTPEPEVMDTVEEAVDYDAMDHTAVNRRFVNDYLAFAESCSADDAESHGHNHQPGCLVDLGTGTAQIPILLTGHLQQAHTILAVDLSWEMLRVALRNIERAGCGQTVQPLYCNARQLPLADGSCRYLLSNSIIHHIPQPASVLSELRRVAAPGAIIFLRDLLRPVSESELEQLVDRWAGDATPHQQQMFRESLHAALTLEEMRGLLDSSGLDSNWVRQTSDRHWTVAGQLPLSD